MFCGGGFLLAVISVMCWTDDSNNKSLHFWSQVTVLFFLTIKKRFSLRKLMWQPTAKAAGHTSKNLKKATNKYTSPTAATFFPFYLSSPCIYLTSSSWSQGYLTSLTSQVTSSYTQLPPPWFLILVGGDDNISPPDLWSWLPLAVVCVLYLVNL